MEKKEFKSDFLNKLQERGFLYQCSSYENLDDTLSQEQVRAYIGFDCTANSLHVGSLVPILLLKYLQEAGHTPYVLIGGGTTLVGDPSGKDKSRQILSKEDILKNATGIKKVISRFLSTEGENATCFVDNSSWLLELNYLEVLREFGKDFTINRMLSFDSVKTRLDRQSPLSFLEFNYMILQAIDFYHLYKNHNIKLQMGGSDQWGNLINGIELIRRKLQNEAFALTTALITNSDGSKMGKTADGALWLDKELLSSWDFYQYFRNVDDLDVIRYLKLYTELPIKQIDELAKLQGKELNEAKKLLAWNITKLVHGEEEANINEKIAINTFEKGFLDTNLPTFFISEQELNSTILLPLLLVKTGLTSSNSEGKRMIQNSGVKINDITINDSFYKVSKKDINQNTIKISIGKKKHILVKLQ